MAWCNCGPQSQRREPKTSPVRHSLCTRTRTFFLHCDFATNQGEVMLAVNLGTVEMQVKIAVIRRHPDGLDGFDQFFAGAAEFDEVGDGAEF